MSSPQKDVVSYWQGSKLFGKRMEAQTATESAQSYKKQKRWEVCPALSNPLISWYY